MLGVVLIWYTRKRPASQNHVADDEEELRTIFEKTIELIEEEKYYLNKNVKLSAIQQFDWGREFFLHDPSGVLWHIGHFNS